MGPTRTRPGHRDARGFTLIEVLVVVTIIGMIASMAVPALRNALYKARRNAALQELRTLRNELTKYASDYGSYPVMTTFDVTTLTPLYPSYIKQPSSVLRNLTNTSLQAYISWNIFDDALTSDVFTTPRGYTFWGTLAFDRRTVFYMTDGTSYIYKDGVLTLIERL